MDRLIVCLLLVTAPFAGTARGDILGAGTSGFHVGHQLLIAAPAADVWAALTRPSDWWNPAHTYSNDASNLTLELNPLGCFCERSGDGGAIVHMTVTAIQPERMLRLTGGLGPLGLLGVDGNMIFSLTPEDGRTRLKFDYVVGGYSVSGLAGMAGDVDRVLGEQAGRLKRYAESGRP